LQPKIKIVTGKVIQAQAILIGMDGTFGNSTSALEHL
jgi:hypothetical protein